jgi:hypothetical protein
MSLCQTFCSLAAAAAEPADYLLRALATDPSFVSSSSLNLFLPNPKAMRPSPDYLVGITRFGSHVVSGGNMVQSARATTIVKKIGH